MNLKLLFSQRRWMLWLPIPFSAWLVAPHWQHIPAMLVGGLIFWIPFWLGWRLSDGFKGMSSWPGVPETIISGINPFTGRPCVVHHTAWGGTFYS